MANPGRNEPCSCGSGLKYKRCCEFGFTGDDELSALRLLGRLMEEAPRREIEALEKQYFGALGSYGASLEDMRCHSTWLTFDARRSDGLRFVDVALQMSELGRGERIFLRQVGKTAMRLYEVVATAPRLVTLQDLLSGEKSTVIADIFPLDFRRKLFLARVIPGGTAEWPEISRGYMAFPAEVRDELLKTLKSGIDDFRAAHPQATALEEYKLAPLILRSMWVRLSGALGAELKASEPRLQQQYQNWLGSASDRLDGLSPRAAVQIESLRPRVVELLRELDREYENALMQGRPTFDPSLFWETLELRELRDGPQERHLPQGHDSVAKINGTLYDLACIFAEKYRRDPRHDLERTIRREVLAREPEFRHFMSESAKLLPQKGLSRDRLGYQLKQFEDYIWIFVNFELHLRKVFKVAEALTWGLGTTALDGERGGDLRLPFASFALVFTDRYALGLAERSLARSSNPIRGRRLHVLTVHVTELQLPGQLRALRIAFLADARTGDFPALFGCTIPLDPEAQLVDILADAAPGEDEAELSPLFACVPLRHLLHLVMNAIIHATSCRPSIESRQEVHEGLRFEPNGRLVSDEVWHLPGDIEISMLRTIQKARLGAIDREQIHRCMVRGYRRRPNPDWKDQSVRWIKPHWRGPSEASIVERQYRLIP